MLKCGTLSKETEQVNEHVRRTVDEEAKVGTKCSVTRSAYTDNTPEDRAKIGRYAAKNGPARATRHFAVSETTRRGLKSEGSPHFVMSSGSGSVTGNQPNLKPAKCFSWQICQILCLPILPAIQYSLSLGDRAH